MNEIICILLACNIRHTLSPLALEIAPAVNSVVLRLETLGTQPHIARRPRDVCVCTKPERVRSLILIGVHFACSRPNNSSSGTHTLCLSHLATWCLCTSESATSVLFWPAFSRPQYILSLHSLELNRMRVRNNNKCGKSRNMCIRRI